MRTTLIPHPAMPSAAIDSIEVEVTRPGAAQLVLRYLVTGRIADLRLSPPAAATRADGLWRTTCFEAFLASAGSTAYAEFNFAPSTHWAAYRFDAERTGMRNADDIAAPTIVTHAEDGRFTLEATLEIAALAHAAPWRLGLTAVIEENGGALSYWALAHPADKPDFHHSGSFVAALPGV